MAPCAQTRRPGGVFGVGATPAGVRLGPPDHALGAVWDVPTRTGPAAGRARDVSAVAARSGVWADRGAAGAIGVLFSHRGGVVGGGVGAPAPRGSFKAGSRTA